MKCLGVWSPSSKISIDERINKARAAFFSHGELGAFHGQLQRRRQLPRSGGAHVLNVKLWGCGNEMILYFSVQLVEKLGGLSPPNLKSGRA